MTKQIRISLTLSDTSYGDQEIIDFIERFGSGKGNQERSFEIKRLLKAAIEQERLVRNFGGSPFSSRTIRPTFIGEDVFQERQALNLEKPAVRAGLTSPGPMVDHDRFLTEKPKLANPVVAADEGSETQLRQQVPKTGNDRANEVVQSTEEISVPPPAPAVSRETAMLGYLMDALAAEEEQKPI